MVRRVLKIIRKMTQEVRPKIYFCESPDSVVYYPDEYTEEIYIEETTPDFPFDNTLEEWRIYAEEEKDLEIREAIERRFNLSQKPTLCLKLEKRPSVVEEIIEYEEEEVISEVEEVVHCPEADIELYEAIQKRLVGYKKQIDKLENKRDALRQKERTSAEVIELRKTINNLERKLKMESGDLAQLDRLREKCPDIEEQIKQRIEE